MNFNTNTTATATPPARLASGPHAAVSTPSHPGPLDDAAQGQVPPSMSLELVADIVARLLKQDTLSSGATAQCLSPLAPTREFFPTSVSNSKPTVRGGCCTRKESLRSYPHCSRPSRHGVRLTALFPFHQDNNNHAQQPGRANTAETPYAWSHSHPSQLGYGWPSSTQPSFPGATQQGNNAMARRPSTTFTATVAQLLNTFDDNTIGATMAGARLREEPRNAPHASAAVKADPWRAVQHAKPTSKAAKDSGNTAGIYTSGALLAPTTFLDSSWTSDSAYGGSMTGLQAAAETSESDHAGTGIVCPVCGGRGRDGATRYDGEAVAGRAVHPWPLFPSRKKCGSHPTASPSPLGSCAVRPRHR